MKLNTIVRILNKELKVRSIPDASRNGLQVRAGTDVKKIGFAVDASMEAFRKAKQKKCDLLVVHHGLLWKGQKDEAGIRKKRINHLKRSKLSLYAVHLPLDRHERLGNNSQICQLLGVRSMKPFGKYRGTAIGYQGRIGPVTLNMLRQTINRKLKTRCRVLPFGRKVVRSIGIVSGGGAAARQEVIAAKLDCFMTGDTSHDVYHFAKEGGYNAIFAGHYATETLGVKSLMLLLKEKFNIETVFIDIPTGM